MKYVIDRKNENLKLANYNVAVKGMEVKPINKVSSQSIKAGKVTLVDAELINSYINQVIEKKLDKIIQFIINILNDDVTGEEDSGMVLDELNRLKGIITKKYKEYMVESEYKAALSKIFIVEEEFKKNYNQKIYMNYLSGAFYQEEYTTGRGR